MTSRTFRSAAAVAVILAASAHIPSATANVIYDFTSTATTGSSGQSILPLTIQLTLDTGFKPESFSRKCGGGPRSCSSVTGNFSTFSLAFYYGGSLLGTLNNHPDLTYEGTSGSLSKNKGSVFWGTSVNTFSLTFDHGQWSSNFNSDDLVATCYNRGCTASGTVTPIPEPAAFGIFVAGLLGLAVTRRKSRHNIGCEVSALPA